MRLETSDWKEVRCHFLLFFLLSEAKGVAWESRHIPPPGMLLILQGSQVRKTDPPSQDASPSSHLGDCASPQRQVSLLSSFPALEDFLTFIGNRKDKSRGVFFFNMPFCFPVTSLKCYECMGEGTCTGTETTCFPGQSKCGATSVLSYAGMRSTIIAKIGF